METTSASPKTVVECPSENQNPTLNGRLPSAIKVRVVLSIAEMWSASNACRNPNVYAVTPIPIVSAPLGATNASNVTKPSRCKPPTAEAIAPSVRRSPALSDDRNTLQSWLGGLARALGLEQSRRRRPRTRRLYIPLLVYRFTKDDLLDARRERAAPERRAVDPATSAHRRLNTPHKHLAGSTSAGPASPRMSCRRRLHADP